MNILLVIDQFDNDNNGTTMTAQRLAKTLQGHGNTVKIVSTGKQSTNKYIVKKRYLTPIVKSIVSSQGMCFAKPDNTVLAKAISECDVVHFLMPFSLSRKGIKIAIQMNKPHTAAFHVQPENITSTIKLGNSPFVNTEIYNFFNKHFFKYFNHIHCPSQFIANELKKNGYKAKLHVISNGVDSCFKYHKTPKYNEFTNKKVILMIGRLSEEKRQDVLINAILKSKYEKNIQLILAGQGPKLNSIAKMSEKLTNKPLIKFFNQKDLLDIIGMSDLYCHSADVEIEAISCIEAFSCGLVPVIANSKKSATPQFALDERSLFEAGNSADLAKKIDYWFDNDEERKSMELKYSEYGKQFNLDNCVYKMEDMFKEAIEEVK